MIRAEMSSPVKTVTYPEHRREVQQEPLPAPLLSIVVPTLNERANIQPLVNALRRTMRHVTWEVIFVDDN